MSVYTVKQTGLSPADLCWPGPHKCASVNVVLALVKKNDESAQMYLYFVSAPTYTV